MSKQAQVVLCGAGRIGNVHLSNILSNRKIKLVAVVDPFIDRAKEMGESVGCPYYETLTEALQKEEFQGVMICTPTHTHVPLIKEALNAGKHVFSEKPIGHEVSAVYEVYDLAKEKGKHLLTGFQRRFDPTFMRLKEELDNGRIGTLHKVKTFSRDNPPPSKEYLAISGGVVHDCAAHDVDLLRWLTGQSPTSVYVGASAFHPDVAAIGDFDVLDMIFKFQSGVVGTVDVARLAVYGYDQRIECLGDKGVLNAQNQPITTISVGQVDGFHTDANKYSFPERYKEAYYNEVDHFVNLILGIDKVPKLTAEDVASVTIMLDAAAESAKTGQIVHITY
jgi:myo-inositol 2-dehydrogenase/D-chiro-inositol 1-dehydrogenase